MILPLLARKSRAALKNYDYYFFVETTSYPVFAFPPNRPKNRALLNGRVDLTGIVQFLLQQSVLKSRARTSSSKQRGSRWTTKTKYCSISGNRGRASFRSGLKQQCDANTFHSCICLIVFSPHFLLVVNLLQRLMSTCLFSHCHCRGPIDIHDQIVFDTAIEITSLFPPAAFYSSSVPQS